MCFFTLYLQCIYVQSIYYLQYSPYNVFFCENKSLWSYNYISGTVDVHAFVRVFMGSELNSSIALERSVHQGEDDSVVVLV